MSIDVLAYNSLNLENAPLRTTNANLTTCINNLNSACSGYQTLVNSNAPIVLSGKVYRPEMWSFIPTSPADGSSWTTGFKVCDTSGYFRCGRCCLWTVPAGVTCARFQIWGAGGMAGAAGCCGGSPFGGSGAYASVIIPVTAGRTYSLCAGCAFCCYACWNTTGNVQGCASYVNGCCLSGFCAQGGVANLCQEMIERSVYYHIVSPVDSRPAFTGCIPYLGYCICGTGSSFCHPQNSTPYSYAGTLCCGSGFASQTHMMLSMYHSSARFNGSAVNGTVYGIYGGYGETCMNHYCKCGYMKHPPIYGFESESQCCFQISGGQTCGGNRCAATTTFGAVTQSMRIPGAGGFAMQVAGGCLTHCGDAGRMGMVCVSYK